MRLFTLFYAIICVRKAGIIVNDAKVVFILVRAYITQFGITHLMEKYWRYGAPM